MRQGNLQRPPFPDDLEGREGMRVVLSTY